MTVHRVPTVEMWDEYAKALADEVGGWPLHYANKTTACGRRAGERMATTTTPSRVTCSACLKSERWSA